MILPELSTVSSCIGRYSPNLSFVPPLLFADSNEAGETVRYVMYDSKFSEYWAQAQFCYFSAEAAKNAAIKHLWIQLAQDWIALAEKLMPESSQQDHSRPGEEMEPFLAA